MQHNDDKLVQLTLEGDHDAFAALVEKYQSQIHALAWRKIGDFHIAEDITQEVFLTAYQKLATLTHPDRFTKWLYVIANNLCITWLRKQAAQPQLQSLTSTDPEELAELCHSEYIAQHREETGKESHRALIQKVLDKLREADRTVIRLYYLAEMTCEEISKFLGVSPNTIKSRLSRARKRLKKQAEAAEPGETAEETAHRELLEETGATLKNLEVLCYIHCFMFNLEYWGIAYLGEIEALGSPLDLEEVSEASLFSHFPENPTNPGPFGNQSKALYLAAMRKLSETKD